MSKKEKVDLRQSGAGRFSVGSKLHAVQICECIICGYRTHNVEIDDRGRWGMKGEPYFRIVCENDEKWHNKINEMIRLMYDRPHPKIYKDALAQEIKDMRAAHQLRKIGECSPSESYDQIIYFANSLHIYSLKDVFVSLGPLTEESKDYWVLD